MRKSFLYILIAVAAFTTLEPVSKLIANDVHPISMTCIRFLIGGVILLPFAIYQKKKNSISLRWQDYLYMALLGVLCICISMVVLQYAVLQADSPALIAIIFSSNSVFTVLLAALFLKEHLTAQKLCAVVLCVAGVLVSADLTQGSNLVSVLMAVLASATFSLYTVLSRKMMGKITGVIQTGFSFFFGSIVLLAVLLVARIPFMEVVTLHNLPYLLYLGIAVTGIGYWAYFRAIEKSSAMAAALVFFIKPVLTPFAALFINGIVPSVRVYIAVVLVVLGSVLASRPKAALTDKMD